MKFAKNILIVGLTNALDSWTIMAERDVEEVTMSDYASSFWDDVVARMST